MNRNIMNNLEVISAKESFINEDKNARKRIGILKKVILCDFKLKIVLNDEYEKTYPEEMKQDVPSVSAAIVVRDEERCILRCIESILAEFDEIIIVDTGSTDNTINKKY